MKKLLSILMALTLLTTVTPANSYCAEADDPELYELASSLGADTDYINIVNYNHDDEHPILWDTFTDYLWNCSLIESAYAAYDKFSIAATSGSCVGISLLEVLAHNGIIAPSDIENNANTLNEITYTSDIDRIITNYQCLQVYTEFDNYEKYLITNLTYDEQINRLINIAEKNMNKSKYFFISIRARNFSHAVCGIGIADGNWEWNGESFDKCILTLDSNIATPEMNAKGFSENACIYINSETKHCYIPAYELNLDDDPAFAVIDDDTLLNYKGKINPTKKINTDISDIKQISSRCTDSTRIYSISDDGTMIPFSEPMFADWVGNVNLIKGKSVHIDMIDEPKKFPLFRYINSDRYIDVSFESEPIGNVYNSEIDISDNNIKIKCTGDIIEQIDIQLRMNKGTYGYSDNFWWYVQNYDLTHDFEVEVKENGMLFKSNGQIKTATDVRRFILDDDGHYKFSNGIFCSEYADPVQKQAIVTSNNNVLISINENREFAFFIDKNNDDEYEYQIEKGDVNFDGMIDASDASSVLAAYSAFSTGQKDYLINHFLADYDENNCVDASDASFILQKYAELSTGKQEDL